jgi:hypothetical protein
MTLNSYFEELMNAFDSISSHSSNSSISKSSINKFSSNSFYVYKRCCKPPPYELLVMYGPNPSECEFNKKFVWLLWWYVLVNGGTLWEMSYEMISFLCSIWELYYYIGWLLFYSIYISDTLLLSNLSISVY